MGKKDIWLPFNFNVSGEKSVIVVVCLCILQISLINRVNQIFRRTQFGKFTGMGLGIKEVIIRYSLLRTHTRIPFKIICLLKFMSMFIISMDYNVHAYFYYLSVICSYSVIISSIWCQTKNFLNAKFLNHCFKLL